MPGTSMAVCQVPLTWLTTNAWRLAGAVCVVPARAAVARRGARHRGDASEPAPVEGRGAGHLDGGVPGAVDLADHERLGAAGAVCVVPARAAVARRGARHRGDVSEPAPVEGRGAGHLDGGVPGAVHLADHERLEVAGAVCVEPARAAVARRGARHRADFSIPALVEGGGAGHLDGGVPGAVDLADHERLDAAGAVGVAPARAAVTRRGARHRGDEGFPAPVEGRGAGHLLRGPPHLTPQHRRHTPALAAALPLASNAAPTAATAAIIRTRLSMNHPLPTAILPGPGHPPPACCDSPASLNRAMLASPQRAVLICQSPARHP